MTAPDLRTSVRLTDRQADEFRALAVLLRVRPHQLAAQLVREGMARQLADNSTAAAVETMVDGVEQAREARAADNVIPLWGRR